MHMAALHVWLQYDSYQIIHVLYKSIQDLYNVIMSSDASWCTGFILQIILQEIHMNVVHIQLQYAGRFAEAQKASQVRLCAALVTVHKLFDVCPSLKYNTTYVSNVRI